MTSIIILSRLSKQGVDTCKVYSGPGRRDLKNLKVGLVNFAANSTNFGANAANARSISAKVCRDGRAVEVESGWAVLVGVVCQSAPPPVTKLKPITRGYLPPASATPFGRLTSRFPVGASSRDSDHRGDGIGGGGAPRELPEQTFGPRIRMCANLSKRPVVSPETADLAPTPADQARVRGSGSRKTSLPDPSCAVPTCTCACDRRRRPRPRPSDPPAPAEAEAAPSARSGSAVVQARAASKGSGTPEAALATPAAPRQQRGRPKR